MKNDIFERIDNLIRDELEKEPTYESFEDVIAEYIAFYCFYSSKDFTRNIIDQLEKKLDMMEVK